MQGICEEQAFNASWAKAFARGTPSRTGPKLPHRPQGHRLSSRCEIACLHVIRYSNLASTYRASLVMRTKHLAHMKKIEDCLILVIVVSRVEGTVF